VENARIKGEKRRRIKAQQQGFSDLFNAGLLIAATIADFINKIRIVFQSY
jgi:hypothetical protein